MRRTLILCAVSLWAAALVITLLVTSPWSGDDGVTRRGAGTAPDSAAAPPASPPQSQPSAQPPQGSTVRGDEAPAPAAGRRKPVKKLPRVRPSLDPLAPAGPVPPEPPAAVVARLGSCCSEPRGNAPVDAIVIHVTESPDRPGTTDLTQLARFLAANGLATQAADDAEGNSSRMVADDRLAYQATYWNVGTVGIEQVAYANLNRKEWLVDRRRQLDTTAAWIAYWARKFRIPIQRCVVAGLRYNRRKRVVAGTIVKRGVCSHAQLDPVNRDDPGPRYPFDYVLAKAREIASRA